MENLLKKTKQLCDIYGIKPARSKGQNFLISEEIYDHIIEAAELKSDETVLEVGPGLGFLTAKLAMKAERVIAVELDDKLSEVLRTGLDSQGVRNVEVVNGDIMGVVICHSRRGDGALAESTREGNLETKKIKKFFSGSPSPRSQARSAGDDRNAMNLMLCDDNYKIVANLPYNITSVFLRKFLSEVEVKPELIVLMLQKEVAERIVARPGKMSLLAVSVQFYADAEIIEYVPKENFWPEPNVDSAIIRIKPREKNSLDKQKTTSEEMVFVASTGASSGIAILDDSITNRENVSSNSVVEVRGVEPLRRRMAIPVSQPATPPTDLSYQKEDKEKIKNEQPPNPPCQGGDYERDFFRLVKFGFSARRKMLKNNLAAGFHISQPEAEKKIIKAGLDPKARAQDLAVEDWAKLFITFGDKGEKML